MKVGTNRMLYNFRIACQVSHTRPVAARGGDSSPDRKKWKNLLGRDVRIGKVVEEERKKQLTRNGNSALVSILNYEMLCRTSVRPSWRGGTARQNF